jgi:hypothetical protein
MRRATGMRRTGMWWAARMWRAAMMVVMLLGHRQTRHGYREHRGNNKHT